MRWRVHRELKDVEAMFEQDRDRAEQDKRRAEGRLVAIRARIALLERELKERSWTTPSS